MCWMWPNDVGRLPHPADHHDLTGDLPSHAVCPPLSQSTVSAVSLSLSTRRRGQMGLTARRVRSGRDCSGWDVALYLTPEHSCASTRRSVIGEFLSPNEPSPTCSNAMRNCSHSIWRTSNDYVNASKSRDRSCLPSTDYNQTLVMRSSGFCVTVSLGKCSSLEACSRACEADLASLLREVQQVVDVPIRGVISDGQHSIRNAVQTVLPDVPHQLCHFHYVREAAKPVYEADRHAQIGTEKTSAWGTSD